MAKSKIEWTEFSWNPIFGCTKISSGCKNCYAERTARRLAHMGQSNYKMVVQDGRWNNCVVWDPSLLERPLHWRKPRRIFVCSMSDLFHEDVPLDFQIEVFDTIQKCQRHIFMVLTKRPENMLEFFGGSSGAGLNCAPLPNVWLGVSCSNQADADKNIPILLQIPAAVHYVSFEPLLEGIDLIGKNKSRMGKKGYLPNYLKPFFCKECGRHLTTPPSTVTQMCGYCGGNSFVMRKTIDWVIVGGESGPGARPMHPQWVRDIRDDCVKAGVPFFFKQWGEWEEATHENAERHGYIVLNGRQGLLLPYNAKRYIYLNFDGTDYQDNPQPGSTAMARVGKKMAGRILDGRIWDEMPDGAALVL